MIRSGHRDQEVAPTNHQCCQIDQKRSDLSFRGSILSTLIFLSSVLMAADKPTNALEALRPLIVSGELPGVHAVIVQHNGVTLADWYFSGPDQTILSDLGVIDFSPTTLHDVRSVTKSVVSLVVSIAMQDGLVTSLDTPQWSLTSRNTPTCLPPRPGT